MVNWEISHLPLVCARFACPFTDPFVSGLPQIQQHVDKEQLEEGDRIRVLQAFTFMSSRTACKGPDTFQYFMHTIIQEFRSKGVQVEGVYVGSDNCGYLFK